MIKDRGKPDTILLILVIILVLSGIVMVFSASYYSTISMDAGPYHYLVLAAQWALAGFGVMSLAILVPYRIYYYLAPVIMVFFPVKSNILRLSFNFGQCIVLYVSSSSAMAFTQTSSVTS